MPRLRRGWNSSPSGLVLALVAWAGALAVAAREERAALRNPAVGADFLPLRHAATALLHGQSVYHDPQFVYPPTATPLFAPTTLGSFREATIVWLTVELLAVALAITLAVKNARLRHWSAVAAVTTAVIIKGDVTVDSISLGNLSLVLAPIAVIVLLLFEGNRWTAGCALLVGSLLVKPLLAPLLLLPAVRRKWRALTTCLLPAALLLALAVLLMPGGQDAGEVLSRVARGSDLRGSGAVFNLSLRGLAESHHMTSVAVWGSAVLVLVAAAAVLSWVRNSGDGRGATPVGGVLILAALLAGSLSEVHYLLVALGATLTAVALDRRPSTLMAAVPGMLVLLAPRQYLADFAPDASGLQFRYVAGELLLLVPLMRIALMGWRPAVLTTPHEQQQAPIHHATQTRLSQK